jgi:hypothetical protein
VFPKRGGSELVLMEDAGVGWDDHEECSHLVNGFTL